jgi:DMSO/TMAO reductase YedYZ heme-binding membrane subunit
MLGGCIATVLLLAPAVTSAPAIQAAMRRAEWLRWQRVGYLALAFTLLHVAALGIKGWFQPDTWPGYLPPITLLTCALICVPLARRMLRS